MEDWKKSLKPSNYKTRAQLDEQWPDYAGETYEVRLPLTFWIDHEERDLPCGEVVRFVNNQVVLNVTMAELREIESDADYYASFDAEDYQENKWVCDAARRMLKALDREKKSLDLLRTSR